jgi:hypothetical protein
MQVFISYLFDQKHIPAIEQALFNSPDYLEKAKSICHGNTVFEPIQVNLIVMLPGQELPLHADVPWFWGATRWNFPQWLLLAMQRSGLYAHREVEHIQGVAYLSGKSAPMEGQETADAGQFFFYPGGKYGEGGRQQIRTKFNTGIVLNGCRALHGVRRFPARSGAQDLPPLPKDADNTVEFVDGHWELRRDGALIRRYNETDVRVSLVWRAHCFSSTEERQRWRDELARAQQEGRSELDPYVVLDELLDELRKRGRLSQDAPRPSPRDLALMLMDEFIRYPVDNGEQAWMPFNYCALPKALHPSHWLRSPLEHILPLLCHNHKESEL